MPTYKIKDGNRLMSGGKKQGTKKIYGPGDLVTMTEEEGQEHAHALELCDSEAAKPPEAVSGKKSRVR